MLIIYIMNRLYKMRMNGGKKSNQTDVFENKEHLSHFLTVEMLKK